MELKITEYNEDITALFDLLMTLEMQLIEQLEVRRPGSGAERPKGHGGWRLPALLCGEGSARAD